MSKIEKPEDLTTADTMTNEDRLEMQVSLGTIERLGLQTQLAQGAHAALVTKLTVKYGITPDRDTVDLQSGKIVRKSDLKAV